MAVIRIGYKRTFQLRPYETQVIELGLEGETLDEVLAQCTEAKLREIATAYQRVEDVGNVILAESMTKEDPRNPSKAQLSGSGLESQGFAPAPQAPPVRRPYVPVHKR